MKAVFMEIACSIAILVLFDLLQSLHVYKVITLLMLDENGRMQERPAAFQISFFSFRMVDHINNQSAVLLEACAR